MSPGKELDEGQLREMLDSRTKSMIEKIDRNIKIGFVVLLVFILLVIIDSAFSSYLLKNIEYNIEIPQWILWLSASSNLIILITFIYFAIKYTIVRKKCNVACNLKNTLTRIIGTLNIYKRMFYFALIVFLITIVFEFITGMLQGFYAGLEQNGTNVSDIETGRLVFAALIGFVIIAALVTGIFLFLRWGFRKLYGNYIQKLRLTLNELEEIG